MPSGGIRIMSSPITVPRFSTLRFIYISPESLYAFLSHGTRAKRGNDWYTHDGQLRQQLEDSFGRDRNCLKGERTVSVRVTVRWDDKVSKLFVESYRNAINGEVICDINDCDHYQQLRSR
jgi:hypothetical protein